MHLRVVARPADEDVNAPVAGGLGECQGMRLTDLCATVVEPAPAAATPAVDQQLPSDVADAAAAEHVDAPRALPVDVGDGLRVQAGTGCARWTAVVGPQPG